MADVNAVNPNYTTPLLKVTRLNNQVGKAITAFCQGKGFEGDPLAPTPPVSGGITAQYFRFEFTVTGNFYFPHLGEIRLSDGADNPVNITTYENYSTDNLNASLKDDNVLNFVNVVGADLDIDFTTDTTVNSIWLAPQGNSLVATCYNPPEFCLVSTSTDGVTYTLQETITITTTPASSAPFEDTFLNYQQLTRFILNVGDENQTYETATI